MGGNWAVRRKRTPAPEGAVGLGVSPRTKSPGSTQELIFRCLPGSWKIGPRLRDLSAVTSSGDDNRDESIRAYRAADGSRGWFTSSDRAPRYSRADYCVSDRESTGHSRAAAPHTCRESRHSVVHSSGNIRAAKPSRDAWGRG